MIRLTARIEAFKVAGTWSISRSSVNEVVVVVAEARDGEHVGRGECRPYPRYDETPEGVVSEIEHAAGAVAGLSGPAGLEAILPPGAARNAVDCALWDLMAKRAGRPVWALAGLPAPKPLPTAFTLSLDSPEAMRANAAKHARHPLLKVKLGGEGDLERIRAVREGAPAARIIVDANEGWTAASYAALAPVLVSLGVEMVEQPFPAGADDALAGMARVLPVCADESCHDSASLPALRGKYDLVNIKLDKTGGLTEAIRLRRAAEAEGYGIMVGCMLASSLSMAPAVLLAQGAAVIDLDGPLLLAEDRPHALTYDAAGVHPPAPELWG